MSMARWCEHVFLQSADATVITMVASGKRM
jgi:hypothetical protein